MIRFESVSKRYAPQFDALRELSFELPTGEMAFLTGHSGAGKSTVFNMLLRLYEASSGAVRVDGHDVRDVSLTSLRRNLALVSQDAFLFDATIRENIALGSNGATDEQIRAAAQAAACDFIEALPGAWSAPAGEAGRGEEGVLHWAWQWLWQQPLLRPVRPPLQQRRLQPSLPRPRPPTTAPTLVFFHPNAGNVGFRIPTAADTAWQFRLLSQP